VAAEGEAGHVRLPFFETAIHGKRKRPPSQRSFPGCLALSLILSRPAKLPANYLSPAALWNQRLADIFLENLLTGFAQSLSGRGEAEIERARHGDEGTNRFQFH
jgi:hypothetical protein